MIRIGIIGSNGKIGKKRCELLSSNPSYTIVATCDTNGKANYTSYKEMVRNGALEAVVICVPHNMATEITQYCIKKELHVFCEKPPSVNLKELEKTLYLKKYYANNKVLMYGFNHRFLKHIQKAKEVIESNKLGKVLWIRGIYGKNDLENWRADKQIGGKGILLSQGIHMVDLVRYLCNTEFIYKGDVISHFDKQWYEDSVMLLMAGLNGVDAFVHSSCKFWKNTFNIQIGLEKGYINIDGLGCSSTHSFGFPDKITIGYGDKMEFYGNPEEKTIYYGADSGEYSWKVELIRFADAINNNKKDYECNIIDALNVMKILDIIYGKESL